MLIFPGMYENKFNTPFAEALLEIMATDMEKKGQDFYSQCPSDSKNGLFKCR